MNWAYFDNAEEKSYLNQTNDYLSFVQCFQADQTKKIMDINFFCPFGLENALLMKTICKKVLKNYLCYYGYHKSKTATVVRKIQC